MYIVSLERESTDFILGITALNLEKLRTAA